MESVLSNDNTRICAVGYIRVSTTEQAEHGLSVESQERTIQKYCTERGYELVKVYSDDLSAKTLNRTGLNSARVYCRRNRNSISKFVFFKLSRLARNLENQITLLSEFRSLGIDPESVTENIENTSIGRAIVNIIGTLNQLDNEAKAEIVAENMLTGRMRGRPMNMLPVGYLNRRDSYGDPYGVIDPDRGHFITEIFKLMDTGAYTQKQLIKLINTKGFTARSGNPLSSQTMNRLLRNRTYTGMIFVSEETGWISSDYIPALIDTNTFDKVQRLLAGKRKAYTSSSRTKRSNSHTLTVFTSCECGSKFTGSYSTSKMKTRHPYYRCRSEKCNYEVRRDELEGGFLALLRSLSPSHELLKAFKIVIKDVYDMKLGDSQKEIDEQEKKLRAAEIRKGNLMNMMLDGIVNGVDFQSKNDQLTALVTDLRITINEKRTSILKLSNVIDAAFSALQHIDRIWLNSDPITRRRIQDVLFPSGLVYTKKGEFRTPEVTKAFNILELLERDKSQLVPPPGLEPELPAPEAGALSN
jgi:site-specific DNA recombinase